MATAMEAIMTGEPIPAQRAYELGMVNKVVSPDEVMVEARDLAKGYFAMLLWRYLLAAKSPPAQ